VINTNLRSILHRFRDIAFDRSKIAIFGCPFAFNAPDGGFLTSHHRKWYIAKTRNFGLYFCRRKFRCIFNHFYAVRAESYRIRWNNAK